MKNPNFTYQINQQKLWFNNSEITQKKVNRSGSCIFFLEETNPSHWITLKLAKAGRVLKAFYKYSQPDHSPQYYRTYFPLPEPSKPYFGWGSREESRWEMRKSYCLIRKSPNTSGQSLVNSVGRVLVF